MESANNKMKDRFNYYWQSSEAKVRLSQLPKELRNIPVGKYSSADQSCLGNTDLYLYPPFTSDQKFEIVQWKDQVKMLFEKHLGCLWNDKPDAWGQDQVKLMGTFDDKEYDIKGTVHICDLPAPGTCTIVSKKVYHSYDAYEVVCNM
jgi:hypothetical protein